MKKYLAKGWRKSAKAQVCIFLGENKNEDFFINKKTIFEYFKNDKRNIENIQYFTNKINQSYDIQSFVSGGGSTGQTEAVCLALARAIHQIDPKILSFKKNLLTQDCRIKERKKYGLKKARKAPQYSKR